MASNDHYFVTFGPKANCTLELCPVERSAYGYQPSLAANSIFIALYSIAAVIHTYLGFRWRTRGFMLAMVAGCLGCVAGYAARLVLYFNPWNFTAFIVSIVLVGTGPVWMCAAIYVTLSKTVTFLSPAYSRLPPKAYYYLFIPADSAALAMQAAGGVLSTNTSGSSQTGVNLTLAGLAFQVATLTIFVAFFIDYMVRYFRSGEAVAFGPRLKVFFAGLASATVLILVRSAYRVQELSHGYSGTSFRSETLFIALEGVIVVVAAYLLIPGHPGPVFDRRDPKHMQAAIESSEVGGFHKPAEKGPNAC